MPFKILIVEDDIDTRELMQFYFMNAGYRVPTAIDGQQGLNMAVTIKPDLILTDLAMPEMDGIEMIRQIRLEPEAAKTPILIFTAHCNLTLEGAMKVGANEVFHKPVDFDELEKAVKAMLHKSKDE